MEASIIVLVLLLLGTLLGILIVSLLRKSPFESKGREKKEGGDKGSPCPICGSILTNGERVKSIVYPGKPDKIMHIFGCPLCYPSGQKRFCPVCVKEIEGEGYLVARVFEKPGKTHVHVLGCSGCRKG